jgi:hypothetical protein
MRGIENEFSLVCPLAKSVVEIEKGSSMADEK